MKYEVEEGASIYDVALHLADLAELEDVEAQFNSVTMYIHRGATPHQITAAYFAETHVREEAYEYCEEAEVLEAQVRLLRKQAADKIAKAVVHVVLDKGM